jgi:hypothetical protein
VKRWLLKVGVFVLAGAIVNVAVAWACVFWSAPTPGGISYAQDVHSESDLSIFRFDHPGKLHIKAMAGDLEGEPYITPTSWAMLPGMTVGSLPARAPSPHSLVPPWARDELLPWGVKTAWPESGGYDSRTIVATGWPMNSLWASFDQVPNPVGYWGWKARSGIRLPRLAPWGRSRSGVASRSTLCSTPRSCGWSLQRRSRFAADGGSGVACARRVGTRWGQAMLAPNAARP